jgi:hypothetical protein
MAGEYKLYSLVSTDPIEWKTIVNDPNVIGYTIKINTLFFKDVVPGITYETVLQHHWFARYKDGSKPEWMRRINICWINDFYPIGRSIVVRNPDGTAIQEEAILEIKDVKYIQEPTVKYNEGDDTFGCYSHDTNSYEYPTRQHTRYTDGTWRCEKVRGINGTLIQCDKHT